MDASGVPVSVTDITVILQKFADAMQSLNDVQDNLQKLAAYNEAVINIYKQGWLAGYHQQSAIEILKQLNEG